MAIKIVAYKVDTEGNDVIIHDSEGESIRSNNVDELIDFLHEPFPEYLCIKIFWDMDAELAPIFKILGVSACRQLAGKDHTYKDLFYITSKVFRIERYDRLSFFYHLSQYYVDDPEPEDVETLYAKAQLVMDGFHAMGLNPKKLTSPVAIYEQEVMSHMDIPTILTIPEKQDEMVEYAEHCLGFPEKVHFWIQAYKIGHFNVGDIWEFDLRAAYPSVAVNLRSLKYAKYAKSPYFQPEADWGFMKGMVTIYDHIKVSPIFDEYGRQPTGTFPAYITKQEYEFIYKWKIGEFKHEMGYYIKFTAPVKPMEVALKRLFNQRGFGSITDMLSKRISTGFSFGKFLEKHDDGTVGNAYNPIYACMVVSINNLKVAEFIYKNELQNDLVHVGVDSVSATKPAKHIGDQSNIGMGDWRFSGIGAVLVLSSGRVYHGDKKPQGLNYDQIVSLISEHPRETFYTANLKRRQTLEESIQLNDLNGIGRLKSTASSFDLGILRANATERNFKDYPHNGNDLLTKVYDSTPLKFND